MAQIVFENFDEKNLSEKEQVLLILEKMLAIQNNLKAVNKKLYDTEEMQIVIDFDNQFDEFWIDAEPNNNERNAPYIEVVTKEVGIKNEMDFLTGGSYSESEIKSYEIGGCLSIYQKLGNSEFYYREL